VLKNTLKLYRSEEEKLKVTLLCSVLLDKLIVAQLVKKLLPFCGARKLIIVFTTSIHSPTRPSVRLSVHLPIYLSSGQMIWIPSEAIGCTGTSWGRSITERSYSMIRFRDSCTSTTINLYNYCIYCKF
jgi:hypothetical protein